MESADVVATCSIENQVNEDTCVSLLKSAVKPNGGQKSSNSLRLKVYAPTVAVAAAATVVAVVVAVVAAVIAVAVTSDVIR